MAQFVAQMLAVHGANLKSLFIANFLATVLAAVALELHVFGLLPSFAAEARLLRWLDVLPLAPRAPPQIICLDAYYYLNFIWGKMDPPSADSDHFWMHQMWKML